MAVNSLPQVATAFLAELEKSLQSKQLHWYKVLVFGSYSKNNFRAESDVDICILVPNEHEARLSEFTQIAYVLSGKFLFDIDVISFTQKDFETNNVSPIIHEIRQNHFVWANAK